MKVFVRIVIVILCVAALYYLVVLLARVVREREIHSAPGPGATRSSAPFRPRSGIASPAIVPARLRSGTKPWPGSVEAGGGGEGAARTDRRPDGLERRPDGLERLVWTEAPENGSWREGVAVAPGRVTRAHVDRGWRRLRRLPRGYGAGGILQDSRRVSPAHLPAVTPAGSRPCAR